ncbi:GNAT family N-acetyltransferase [Halobacteriovorax sp. GB3]|uniref:GNAT family N-acetyltransferase n=1 Tax=Halobacteriovorax sp. GB3 TaxID=2719615 RepID=UPI00235F7977|nr:GNAT family N-acetyltransferase [Halobacteriovorax sp. GB3]MDD0853746.1 GNAT family N-acetyltransferase [Halobacteriovorax sp. GB3]
MLIQYSTNLDLLEKLNIEGFFVGWPSPPSSTVFRKLLEGSYKAVLAFEDHKLVGFVNSISDGVLSAYIPLLEVLPTHHNKGIGKELIKRIQKELEHLYMVDLLCDQELISYYEKLGMMKAQGACMRNYDRQSGN